MPSIIITLKRVWEHKFFFVQLHVISVERENASVSKLPQRQHYFIDNCIFRERTDLKLYMKQHESDRVEFNERNQYDGISPQEAEESVNMVVCC